MSILGGVWGKWPRICVASRGPLGGRFWTLFGAFVRNFATQNAVESTVFATSGLEPRTLQKTP